jgi:hypothetical protein
MVIFIIFIESKAEMKSVVLGFLWAIYLDQEISCWYGIRLLIARAKKTHNWNKSFVSSVQFTSSQFVSLRLISILSCHLHLYLLTDHLSWRFPVKMLYVLLILPCTLQVLTPLSLTIIADWLEFPIHILEVLGSNLDPNSG